MEDTARAKDARDTEKVGVSELEPHRCVDATHDDAAVKDVDDDEEGTATTNKSKRKREEEDGVRPPLPAVRRSNEEEEVEKEDTNAGNDNAADGEVEDKDGVAEPEPHRDDDETQGSEENEDIEEEEESVMMENAERANANEARAADDVGVAEPEHHRPEHYRDNGDDSDRDHNENAEEEDEETIPTPEEVELEYTYPQDFIGKKKRWKDVVRRDAVTGRYHYFRLIIDPACISVPPKQFLKCKYLIEIVYPEGNESQLRRIAPYAFEDCCNLQRMNKFPDGLVELGDSAFRDCWILKGRITLPPSIRYVRYCCFESCEAITGILFEPSTSTTTTTTVVELGDHIFRCCLALLSVRLPQNLTVIPYCCFFGCDSLVDVAIPERVRTIGEAAYRCCSVLARVTIPLSTNAVQVGRDAFDRCPRLSTIQHCVDATDDAANDDDDEDGNEGNDHDADGEADDDDGVVEPEQHRDDATHGSEENEDINEEEEEEVGVAEPEQHDEAFTNAEEDEAGAQVARMVRNRIQAGRAVRVPTPEEVELEYTYPQDFVGRSWEDVVATGHYFRLILDPSCIEIPSKKFLYCEYLIDIVYPEGTDSKLLRIGRSAFGDCSNLQRMNPFPDGLIELGYCAFSSCPNLQGRITIPSSIQFVRGRCFAGCGAIIRVVFEEPRTSTATTVVELHNHIFQCCYELRSVRLPKNLTVIPSECFYGCDSLIDVPIPGTVRTIQSLAFADCALSAVDLPESVIVIGEEAYQNCSVLVSFIIRSLTNEVQIGRKVFGACPSLTTIRVVNPLIWSQLFSAMNTDPSFLYRFVRKYEGQIMTHHRSSR